MRGGNSRRSCPSLLGLCVYGLFPLDLGRAAWEKVVNIEHRTAQLAPTKHGRYLLKSFLDVSADASAKQHPSPSLYVLLPCVAGRREMGLAAFLNHYRVHIVVVINCKQSFPAHERAYFPAVFCYACLLLYQQKTWTYRT